jgi:small subunit ribosomal protein S17
MEGKINSIIDSKTAVVLVENKMRHPLYGKVLKRVKKLLVHIPEGVSPKEGEMVEVFASRPISKKKKWTLK